MICIGTPAQEMAPRFAYAPGGYAWWYLDVITPGGDGLVLIWSYGLPFLPGYARASRAGRPQRPVERPSLNVVLYRGGRPTLYLLQEHEAGEAEAVSGFVLARGAEEGEPEAVSSRWSTRPAAPAAAPPLELRMGGSRLVSRVEGGRRRVEVELDCPVAGTRERVRGTVRVDGVARRPEGNGPDPADEPHVWTPLTGPASGRVSLRFGGESLADFEGRAYHDRNGGSVPLHGLGMSHWMWGRFPFRDREAIYYVLWPHGESRPRHCLGVEIGAEGETRRIPGLRLETEEPRRTLGGIPWARRLRIVQGDRPWLQVRHTHLVDSGPFYLRMISEGVAADGESVTGFGELCYPDRVDLDVHRPFVRMCVQRVAGGNSPWLPLFTGPRHGRVGRLLGHLLPGTR